MAFLVILEIDFLVQKMPKGKKSAPKTTLILGLYFGDSIKKSPNAFFVFFEA